MRAAGEFWAAQGKDKVGKEVVSKMTGLGEEQQLARASLAEVWTLMQDVRTRGSGLRGEGR